MIFTELRFLIFFAVVFAIHWSLRGMTARKSWLLVASYAFYAAWDARFLALIGLATAIAWGSGETTRQIGPSHSERPKKKILLAW